MRIWFRALLPAALLLTLVGMAGAVSMPAPFPPDVLILDEQEPMVPLAPLATLLGATVSIDADGRTLVQRDGKSFTCTPNLTGAQQQGKAITLKVAPCLRSGVLYVPLRPLVESLGAVVEEKNGLYMVMQGATILALPCTRAGGNIALLDNASSLYATDIDGAVLRRLNYASGPFTVMGMTPDGAQWLCWDGGCIVLRAADGSRTTPLLERIPQDRTAYGNAVLSADGRTVLFTQFVDDVEGADFGLIGIDGTQKRLLGKGVGIGISADGSRILFTRANAAGNEATFVIGADGKNEQKVGEGFAAKLSPDGARVLFSSLAPGADGTPTLSLSLATLTGERVDIAPGAVQAEGAFHPDGKRIVYAANEAICTVDVDGKNAHPVNDRPGCRRPSFTADGARILFLCNNALYSMQADGTNEHPLLTGFFIQDYTLLPGGFILVQAMPESPYTHLLGTHPVIPPGANPPGDRSQYPVLPPLF